MKRVRQVVGRDGNYAYFRTRKFQRSKTATEKQDNKPKKIESFGPQLTPGMMKVTAVSTTCPSYPVNR